MTLDTLLKTALLSLRHPRMALRVVLSWNLSLSEGAMALGLMAIVSAGLASLVMQVPPETDAFSAAILSNPLYLGIVQTIGLGLISIFIHLIGRVSHGRGTLPQAVALMAWVEAMWIVITVVEIVTVILLPPVAMIVLLLGTVLSLSMLVSFVMELHGFSSWFLTLLGVIAAFVGAMMAAVFCLMVLFVLGVLHV